jgi:hypothetical protein
MKLDRKLTKTQEINIENLKNLLKELLDFYESELKLAFEYKSNNNGQNNVEIFVYLSLCKIIKTLRAILLLSSEGYGEDASVLSRTVFEGYINLAYVLKEDSDIRVKLFNSFSDLDYYQKLNSLKATISDEKLVKSYEEALKQYDVKKMEEIKSFRKSQKKKLEDKGYKGKTRDESWSLLSLKIMSDDVGMISLYNQIYWQVSQISHPHQRGLDNYLRNTEKSTIYNDSPTYNWVPESLFFSIDIFIRVLNLVNEHLISIEKRIVQFKSKLNDINFALSQEGNQ